MRKGLPVAFIQRVATQIWPRRSASCKYSQSSWRLDGVFIAARMMLPGVSGIRSGTGFSNGLPRPRFGSLCACSVTSRYLPSANSDMDHCITRSAIPRVPHSPNCPRPSPLTCGSLCKGIRSSTKPYGYRTNAPATASSQRHRTSHSPSRNRGRSTRTV